MCFTAGLMLCLFVIMVPTMFCTPKGPVVAMQITAHGFIWGSHGWHQVHRLRLHGRTGTLGFATRLVGNLTMVAGYYDWIFGFATWHPGCQSWEHFVMVRGMTVSAFNYAVAFGLMHAEARECQGVPGHYRWHWGLFVYVNLLATARLVYR
jgi:hypothetical protein